jgi:hypothetical protein
MRSPGLNRTPSSYLRAARPNPSGFSLCVLICRREYPGWPNLILGSGLFWITMNLSTEGTKAPRKPGEMSSTVTHIAAVVAGLAIFVTGFTVSRRGLLPSLVAAVAFGVAAAVLISAVRSLG